MESNKRYYNLINLIRFVSCIGVLLYHLGIIKGGYLAVCTFFTLTGYLVTISAFKDDKFKFKDYYFSKIKRIYIPLITVIFITIVILSNKLWINLKPEVTSILLGNNNYWQLNANLDYFTRHISSPFMHLWYISILLQFYLIFPFIFIILRKIGDKVSKFIPCIITFIFSILFSIYIYKYSINGNIMNIYYDTFTRVFSILFGVSLAFIQHYYNKIIPRIFRTNPLNKIIFYVYLLFLILLFIFVDSNSIYISFGLIVATLISVRLVAYSTTLVSDKLNIIDKIIKFISDISYEIYLVQYPVIFIIQEIEMNNILKIISIISITLLISFILHYSLRIRNNNNKINIFKLILCIAILSVSIYGGYLYLIAKDHTEEMNNLKKQLEQNELLIKQQQEQYKELVNKEENDWNNTLDSLANDESKIDDIVTKLPIVGIGDSIMLGAVGTMRNKFPNSYFDAKVSRTAYAADAIIKDLLNKNMLGNPIIFNLGANGDCNETCKNKIMNDLGNRQVFWMTVTNDKDVYFNNKIKKYAEKYSNLHIIDWEAISKGHSEYFFSDGLHLTTSGRMAYTNAIYDTLYKIYKDEYDKKKEDIINKHNEELKNKVTFYGNELLLNVMSSIKDDYSTSNFIINKEYTFDKIKKELSSTTLTHKLVFMFNNILTNNQYKKIIDMCKDNEIYVISLNKDLDLSEYSNVKVIDFYSEIKEHDDYLFIDRTHLSDKGIKALREMLVNIIK